MSDLLKEMGINPKKVVPKKDVPKKNDKDKKMIKIKNTH